MEWIVENWYTMAKAAVGILGGIALILGALPNKLVKYRSYILKATKFLDEIGDEKEK